MNYNIPPHPREWRYWPDSLRALYVLLSACNRHKQVPMIPFEAMSLGERRMNLVCRTCRYNNHTYRFQDRYDDPTRPPMRSMERYKVFDMVREDCVEDYRQKGVRQFILDSLGPQPILNLNYNELWPTAPPEDLAIGF